jgi:hypothetical protein
MTLRLADVVRRVAQISQNQVDDYLGYWDPITPRTAIARQNRWIFAFLSIRSHWRTSVRAYNAVMAEQWSTYSGLYDTLVSAKSGLWTVKAEGIWNLMQLIRAGDGHRVMAHPAEVGRDNKPWTAWRDLLLTLTFNGGEETRKLRSAQHKTISFAHEMCWPRQCRVVAVDTHVAKWYGIKVSKGKTLSSKNYLAIEQHFLRLCAEHGYPPAIVRHILWDQDQGEENTRYWAHVFENEPTGAPEHIWAVTQGT